MACKKKTNICKYEILKRRTTMCSMLMYNAKKFKGKPKFILLNFFRFMYILIFDYSSISFLIQFIHYIIYY